MIIKLESTELFDGIQGSEDLKSIQSPVINVYKSEQNPQIIPNTSKVIYKLQGQAKSISSGGFEPYHDAPAFLNFHSIATDLNNTRRYAPGTCHGVSYLTAMWYAGIYKPLAKIKPSPKGRTAAVCW